VSDAFDAAMPPPYSDNWKQAERASPEDSPRLTSYQAPGGEEIQFILKSFKFSGGQSLDTAEYPFGGLWSNETLNEKPQELHIEGFIRGAEYIQTRNALIEALRITTDDSEPGYIDFPFWGRFPIVVVNYEVAENFDEKGQCSVSLVFKRAGVSITERAGMSLAELADSPSGISASQADLDTALETALEDLETVAIYSFEQALANNNETSTLNLLSQGSAQIKSALLSALGRIQAAQTMLNTISSEINSITSLTSQLIRSPGQLARSLFNAAASIVGGLAEIRNSATSYLRAGNQGAVSPGTGNSAGSPSSSGSAYNNGQAASKSSYPAPVHNNEQNVLLHFLSAGSFSLGTIPLTVRQEAVQKAIENLYRICAFVAAGGILPQLDMSFQKTEGYWKLFTRLEASIDRNDPAVYAALETVRIYASRILSAKALSSEKRRYLNAALPLLPLVQYLGCGEEKLRGLNRIADSFVIKGGVLYV
jgi:hypothetical protein